MIFLQKCLAVARPSFASAFSTAVSLTTSTKFELRNGKTFDWNFFPASPRPEAVQFSRLPEKAGTTVLLVHGGEPRSNFYARKHLSRLFVDHLRVLPKWASSAFADFYFALSPLPAKCILDSVDYAQNAVQLQFLSTKLGLALSQLLSEFGPIRCLPITMFEEGQFTFERQIQNTLSQGIDNLVVLSLLPLHHKNRFLFSLIRRHIISRTVQVQDVGDEGVESAPQQYFVQNTATSFNLLVIDRISASESFVQYWSNRILPLMDRCRAIIFLATRSTGFAQFEEVARRVMYAVYSRSPLCTPWRCALYSDWPIPFGHFAERLLCWHRRSVAGCVRRLRKSSVCADGPILVVPLDTLLTDCFDTRTTLPMLFENTLRFSDRHMVTLLQSKSLAEDSALIHSLAELVKHVLLNPAKFKCPNQA